MDKKKTVMIKNLCIGYKGKKANKIVATDINYDIYSGELTCLLGSNGVGKSTLLRTLSGFQPKLSGHIFVLGKELDHYSDKELSQTIGIVLTEKPDVRNMTVFEMVGLGRSPYTGFWGNLSIEDEQIVCKAITQVGIESLAQRMIQTLSDGERQKVMIAKALAQETPLIFLDEPTAFLDYPSKIEVMHLLLKLCKEADKTVFLSTHDLELALQVSDKICLMHEQKGIMVGAPEDLSINGSLGSFFEKGEMVFDEITGLYRVSSEVRSTIRLVGDGLRYAMVSKALKRNGIYAASDVNTANFIETNNQDYPESYIIHIKGKDPIRVPKIEDVVKQLLTETCL